MKKSQMVKEINFLVDYSKHEKVFGSVEKFEGRVSGKKGAEDARDRFFSCLKNIYKKEKLDVLVLSREQRKNRFIRESAEKLAALAGQKTDEHAVWSSGDHLTVYGLDFVGPWESAKAPYFDMGGEGLGLVRVTRKRVYAKSSNYLPSYVSTNFLVGKNEAGTYFSHPVSLNCETVAEAVQWIWGGKAYQIIVRQGDIALIDGNGGPKMPKYLPNGHINNGNFITHDTHPSIPLPQNPGERIVVGRRAAERASEATRD